MIFAERVAIRIPKWLRSTSYCTTSFARHKCAAKSHSFYKSGEAGNVIDGPMLTPFFKLRMEANIAISAADNQEKMMAAVDRT